MYLQKYRSYSLSIHGNCLSDLEKKNNNKKQKCA